MAMEHAGFKTVLAGVGFVLALAACKKDDMQVPVAPTTAVPAGVAGAPGACAKDTDCKGDRVCEKGACVAPH